MANYDRQFLVPYLRDVCTSELICSKLENEIQLTKMHISNLNSALAKQYVTPPKPKQDHFVTDGSEYVPFFVIGIIAVAIASFVWYKLSWIELFAFVAVLGFIFGGFMIVCGIIGYFEEKGQVEVKYQEALARYEQIKNENEKMLSFQPKQRENLAKYQRELPKLESQLIRARYLRSSVYDVNVIPKQYRNIYAAYYLYDFFSSGRETDLEKVIQTFVLEEIKQRLDKIIVQNEQIILNQRVQMAMQEQQNCAIAENHREQMRRLAKMESNQELQLDYQRMIEKNQEVTNFILAADFYKKYH